MLLPSHFSTNCRPLQLQLQFARLSILGIEFSVACLALMMALLLLLLLYVGAFSISLCCCCCCCHFLIWHYFRFRWLPPVAIIIISLAGSLLLLFCMLPLLRQEKFFVFPTFSFFAFLLTFSLKIVRKVNYVALFFKLNVTKSMFVSIEF